MTTISISPADIRDIIDVGSIVGSIVATTLAVWIVYLMVRPSRRVREQRRRDSEESFADTEEMWAIIDRMESRLEVLERVVAAEERSPRIARRPKAEDEDRLLSPADGGRDAGGKE
jgi:hypothetical protein